MQTDRRTYVQTDMTKLIVVFRNFVNAPKNDTFLTEKFTSICGIMCIRSSMIRVKQK